MKSNRNKSTKRRDSVSSGRMAALPFHLTSPSSGWGKGYSFTLQQKGASYWPSRNALSVVGCCRVGFDVLFVAWRRTARGRSNLDEKGNSYGGRVSLT